MGIEENNVEHLPIQLYLNNRKETARALYVPLGNLNNVKFIYI